MSTTLVAIALTPDDAGHIAVALHRHRGELERLGMAEPSVLADLEDLAAEVFRSSQQESVTVTALGGGEDGLHDRVFLSRRDVQRLVGVSLSTVDRWLASGGLRSVRHGRTLRIARADLDAFLAPRQTEVTSQ